MAATATRLTAGIRAGTVGAYITGGDLDLVRDLREVVGHVTVAGKSGLRVLARLHADRDLWGVDLDPACYLDRGEEEDALIPIDWIGRQRELKLSVVRSPGIYVPRDDGAALRAAFGGSLPDGTVRTVSLNAAWLRGDLLRSVLAAIRHCDDPLALVFAAAFDPLAADGAIDGLRSLLDAASPSQRRVELLRTDMTGVGFAAAGGVLGSVGVTTTGRHHGLPLGQQASEGFTERQAIPLVFVRGTLSWQRGTTLGALSPFGGAGLVGCDCGPCDGRSLLRFDRVWPGTVPGEVRADARAHDVRAWLALSRDVLSADDPLASWRAACRDAERLAAQIADQYKVVIQVPSSVSGWA